MAIELRNRLHSQFGGAFTINATAVFDYPTIGGLAEYLVSQLAESESPTEEAQTRRSARAHTMIGRNNMSGNDFHARDENLHSFLERARR